MTDSPKRQAASIAARFLGLASALFILAATGCAVSQTVVLAPDGSGRGELTVDLHPMFVNYYRDLLISFGGDEDLPIFDIAAIEAGFAQRDTVELLEAEIVEPGTLRLAFSFADIETAFQSIPQGGSGVGAGPGVGSASAAEGLGLVSFDRDGARRILSIFLDRSVVAVALGMVPVAEMGSVGLLLPPEGSDMSADEYADYVAWALEEYAGDADAFEVIRRSSMELTISVEGTPISVGGGKRIAGGARFEIPIVELLTLAEPRRYELRYRVD